MSTSPNSLTLAVNSGSSSLKIGFFDGEVPVLRGEARTLREGATQLRITDSSGAQIAQKDGPQQPQEQALQQLIGMSRRYIDGAPATIGHRIVHGGPELQQHQPITTDLLEKLAAAEHFAPLHIPQSLKLIRQAQQIFAGASQFACFDTAFHRTMPEVARRLPLPSEFDRQGVRRYGFHGLSYESLVHRLAGRLPERVVLAHLGSGSSLCALRNGVSIDTTMGMTPAGGVVMGTRSGDLDPGVLLFLVRSKNLDADQLETLLNHQSGLVALSGGEPDMQALLTMSGEGDRRAELAVDSYCTSIRKAIGAYAALLGGVDLLVFTGGIGEHSLEIRSRICGGLGFLGLVANGSRVIALPTDEEGQIARICCALSCSPAAS